MSPDESAATIGQAQQLADATDSHYLQHAVQRAAAGEVVSPFGRFRRAQPQNPALAVRLEKAAVSIDVPALSVLKNGEFLKLSERVRELLMCIATIDD